MTYIETTDNFIASLRAESYRVGGSVRDELIGRRVKDADYLIRGVPLRTLQRRLEAALDNGNWPKPSVTPLRLRTGGQGGWRVSARGLGVIEIMLPRKDVARALTPEEQLAGVKTHSAFDIFVDPELSLAEDAKRRDFTFNALYKGVGEGYPATAIEGGVSDPLGRGLYDLAHKIVNTTYEYSFRDDPLRTLRALRFVSTLGYDLGASTEAQMVLYADSVTGLSAKGYASGTVLSELTRILMGADVAKALRIARDTGVLAHVLPELAPMLGFDQGSRYHDLTTDEHVFTALETAAKVEAPLRVRMALLFHDSGKPETAWRGEDGRMHYYKRSPKQIAAQVEQGPAVDEDHETHGERIWLRAASRLNAERDLKLSVATIIREHMVPIKTKNLPTRVRRMRVKLGDDLLRDLLMHRMCDLSGKGYSKVNLNALQHIAKMEAERQKAAALNMPASTKDLKINGHDLMTLGVEGKAIGQTLNRVLDEVICRPDEQTLSREWQLGRAGALA